MKTVPAGKFKAHCLALLDEVEKTRETVVVTMYGRPVARVIPYSFSAESRGNPLKNSIVFERDLIAPIDVEWKALQRSSSIPSPTSVGSYGSITIYNN